MSTYCGKDCETCAEKLAGRCSDCDYARQYYGCEIAECCRRKSHDSCDTCTQGQYCELYKQRKTMPEARLRKNEQLYEKSHVLAKWLMPLFWLMIALLAIDFIGTALQSLPYTAIIKSAAMIVIELLYVFLLYKMKPICERYGTAAKFRLIGIAITAVEIICTAAFGDNESLDTLIGLPSAVVGFIAIYQEFEAHSDVLVEVDELLSHNWNMLWKWYIGLTLGTILLPVVAIFGGLGVLIIIAYMVALVIVSVLKLVYLRRTACAFRDMFE